MEKIVQKIQKKNLNTSEEKKKRLIEYQKIIKKQKNLNIIINKIVS